MYESYSRMVQKAYEIAKEAHRNQVDKAGQPYINHPVAVADRLLGDEDAMTVALLHDVVEDTEYTFEDMAREFPTYIVDALRLVTHPESEAYEDYINRIKSSGDSIAIKVKVADLEHNMDLNRIPVKTQRDFDRVEKRYKPALKLLLS